MTYEIQQTRCATIHTAVIRERVAPPERPRFIPAACGEVWTFLRSAKAPHPGRHVALYLAENELEVGAEVGEPFTGNERVRCSRLPAGKVITTIHFGPYPRLREAHSALRAWCTEHARTPAGPAWEIYGHWEERWNADPSQIRTDVFYLLA